jgi:NADH:ubiquinone oxidoreductase subunit E
MGSSCFAHGNQMILEHIKAFLAKNVIESEVDLKGSLCQGCCKDGPSVLIDGTLYTKMNIDKINKLLHQKLPIFKGSL